MSTTPPTHATSDDLDHHLAERLAEEFLDTYARDAIGELLNGWPNDVHALPISWRDLYRYDQNVADDALAKPELLRTHLEEALEQYNTTEVNTTDVPVRIHDLPDSHTFYPGTFSPTDHAGEYRALQGEVVRATDVLPKIEEAAFECQRCGTLTRIPQGGGDFQEPHQCQGCDRQGPFKIDFDRSEFVDHQVLRLQTPPEQAEGAGSDIDIRAEGDLAGEATVGDRITVCGTIHLEQKGNQQSKSTAFDIYVAAEHLEFEETDRRDIDITPDERERIHALADGAEGDPVEVAGESLAPRIFGHDTVKQMLVLSMVAGSRTVYPTGDADRGEFHVLLIGDPSTAKSKLIQRSEQIGWRTVGVSGKGATTAGVTASARQDDFGAGNGGEWTLHAGAFVKAHRGTVCIDELDDMDPSVRAAMLEPMSNQSIHVTKAGINAHLSTQTAVVAAANPQHGRFDKYSPTADQFDLAANLLSRFDLIYTFHDRMDPERDNDIAEQILGARDAAKRMERGEDVPEADRDKVEPPVEPTLLRKWIALAKRSPKPVFASDAVKDSLKDSFTDLRGMYDYSDEDPVPVTFRKLEGIVRIAEAAAKFEFSETIEQRHADLAINAVGESMQDFQTDEDGHLDADIQEAGQSMSQKKRRKLVADCIDEVERDSDEDVSGAAIDAVVERAEEEGLNEDQVYHAIQHFKDIGHALEPRTDYIRFIGGAR